MSDRSALLIEVRLHADRYHGEPEWPPAPGRLFQALLAGAARGARVPTAAEAALGWLESLAPPLVGAPAAVAGQRIKLWVPNNDLDAKRGDPAEIPNIRTAKSVRPRLLDARVPFLFAWPFAGAMGVAEAETVCSIADDVYQFGRGVDLAWARAALLEEDALEARLREYRGQLYEPGEASGALVLSCPVSGSLASLRERYNATLRRLEVERVGKKSMEVFRQPPKARFRSVAYNVPVASALFELQQPGQLGRFAAHPQTEVVRLVETVRDRAAARLAEALPGRAADVERALVGRTPDGWKRLAPRQRARLIPLPSIGHTHVERSVRRLLVQVPSGCPLDADDVFWAVSGLELHGAILTRSEDERMLRHFAIGLRSAPTAQRVWRSVTPVALPEAAGRRRIDPAQIAEQAKPAKERLAEEARARKALRTALRQAGVDARLLSCTVQREPFARKGARAEDFAGDSRFSKHRLWHAELRFETGIRGPLLIGDGRFLGLGLFAPERPAPGERRAFAWRATAGWQARVDAEGLTRALRRAVQARYQEQIGKRRTLPSLISGHGAENGPAQGHRHLYFLCDPDRRTLAVLAPPRLSRREGEIVDTLAEALNGFDDLRAGRAGRLRLEPCATEFLFATATRWRSVTPYQVRRHRKGVGAQEALRLDLLAACKEQLRAIPEVDITEARGSPGRGLQGHARLHFPVAITGPLVLGRSAHRGGGLFVPYATDPP